MTASASLEVGDNPPQRCRPDRSAPPAHPPGAGPDWGGRAVSLPGARRDAAETDGLSMRVAGEASPWPQAEPCRSRSAVAGAQFPFDRQGLAAHPGTIRLAARFPLGKLNSYDATLMRRSNLAAGR